MKPYRYTKIFFVLALLISLCACEQFKDSHMTSQGLRYAVKDNPCHPHVWTRIQDNYQLITTSKKQLSSEDQELIEKHLKKFIKNKAALEHTSMQAAPYLYYIVSQLEKRNMPGELALLPIIESSFVPHATSTQGAVGLWQFIPSTAEQFGLKQDAWYDGRRDITASTEVALNYLQSLYQQFDQDWLLALAAYNAGPARIQRAIRKNEKIGKGTSFWELSLPSETRHYIPKILALAVIMADPHQHELQLPPIENKPYFKAVHTSGPIHFTKAAQLAELHIDELKRLNPAYSKFQTHPKGPHKLLLPIENVLKFQENFTLQAQGIS